MYTNSSPWGKAVLYFSFPLIISCLAHDFFYHYTHLSLKNSLLIYLPTLLILVSLQYCLKKSLYHWSILAPAVIALAWSVSFILFNFYGNGEIFPFTESMGNYLFGVGIFALLIFLQIFLTVKFHRAKLWAALFAAIDLILAIVPLAQLSYFLKYHKGLTMDSLFALYQTNISEAWEFLQAEIAPGAFLILILALIICAYLAYRLNLSLSKTYPVLTLSKWKYLALVLFLAVSVVFFFKTNIINTLYKIHDYSAQLENYNSYQAKTLENLTVDQANAAITKTPGTIILVIGESAARDQMKVFNPKLPVDNTPWQSAMAQEDKVNFHFFPHAYTSWVQTVPSLQRALTQENQYEKHDFLHSANIINVANKLGYHTYWFSNQQIIGQYDTATTLIAKRADTLGFTRKELSSASKYDGELLPFLKSVPKGQNNFIILHLMGSHLGYQIRYPENFAKYKDLKHAAYYNTILYNDYILQQIFTYAKENLNLQAMVYFSDHGEDMVLNHNPDTFTFAMDRIPLWVYTSNAYNKAYPLTFKTLEEHKNKYFTNDLLYDLMVGLLQAKGNTYEPAADLSNPAYKYNENNLTTNFGKTKISEDPYLHDTMPAD